jgi:hypothetical protein
VNSGKSLSPSTWEDICENFSILLRPYILIVNKINKNTEIRIMTAGIKQKR